MARKDEIRKQNPNLDISLIDIIASADPTTTHKYLPFLIKVAKGQIPNDKVAEFIAQNLFGKERIDTLKRFEEHAVAKRIGNTDISAYRDFDQILTEVKKGDEVVRLRELEKQTIKLYDANGWMVMIPLTYEAGKTYGTNTKWCITQKIHWDSYQWKYKLIFIIDKNNNRKYAISKNYDDHKDIKAWLADDSETSPMSLPLPQEVWPPLMADMTKAKYQSEIDSLKPDTIIISNGEYKTIEAASATEISWFLGKFNQVVPSELREKCKNKMSPPVAERKPATVPPKKKDDSPDFVRGEFLKHLADTFKEKKFDQYVDLDDDGERIYTKSQTPRNWKW